MQIVDSIEKKFMKTKIPNISIGDQVEVSSKIVEGDKERIQKFIGTVIAKKGAGMRANFTVRRIVQGEGAERIFPIHSPNVKKVEVVKSSKVRRAKLYYLRDRKGKETRLKEKFSKLVSKAERIAAKAELRAKLKAEAAQKSAPAKEATAPKPEVSAEQTED